MQSEMNARRKFGHSAENKLGVAEAAEEATDKVTQYQEKHVAPASQTSFQTST